MIEESNKDLWFFQEYHKLKCGGSDSLTSIIELIAKAKIDANPHQIDAVIFALSNLVNNGVILADEVGLGKTIEAGLILSSYFHSGKKRILIIPPNSLIEQWEKELKNLFGFSASVYRKTSEFDRNINNASITIITDHVAKSSEKLLNSNWDLVIIDEVHRYRNFMDNVEGRFSNAVENLKHIRPLLLTATPIQTDISDLFSIVGILRQDPHRVYEELSDKYNNENIELLADSMDKEFFRTLRKDVHTVNYPPRKVTTVEILENNIEADELSNIDVLESNFDSLKKLTKAAGLLKSSFLNYYSSTPQMCALVLYNSAYNIATNLNDVNSLHELKNIKNKLVSNGLIFLDENEDNGSLQPIQDPSLQKSLLDIYINILKMFSSRPIKSGKLNALLEQVKICLSDKDICPNQKVVIFTQFTTSQQIIVDSLVESGLVSKEEVQIFNGNDNSYENIFNFKFNKKVLVITDAGCFGLNLQFCNCLINFDFPWNPMTIEQRIGRIHRYGQKYTANIFNTVFSFFEFEKNKYDVLVNRCNISKDLFGASNEILSDLESHKDYDSLQKAIRDRQLTNEEINLRYNRMIQENAEKIDKSIESMKSNVLNILDEKSRSLLKIDKSKLDSQLYSITEFTKVLFETAFPNNWIWNIDNTFEAKKRPALLEPKNEFQKYQISTTSTTEDVYVKVGYGHPLFNECLKIVSKKLELTKRSKLQLKETDKKLNIALYADNKVHFVDISIPEYIQDQVKEKKRLILEDQSLIEMIHKLTSENISTFNDAKKYFLEKYPEIYEKYKNQNNLKLAIKGIFIDGN